MEKTRKSLSPKSILKHHCLLSAMLHKAVNWQFIVSSHTNRVQQPKSAKPIRPHYNEAQTKIIFVNLEKLTGKDVKYHVAILLDIFTRARLGELVELE